MEFETQCGELKHTLEIKHILPSDMCTHRHTSGQVILFESKYIKAKKMYWKLNRFLSNNVRLCYLSMHYTFAAS